MPVIPSSGGQDEGVAPQAGGVSGPIERTGFFANIGAEYQAAVAGPGSTRNRQAIYEARYYDQIAKALDAQGEQGVDYVQSPVMANSPLYRHVEGERVNANGIVYVPVKRKFRNPYAGGVGSNPIADLYLGGNSDERSQMWGAIQRVRQRNPGFLKEFKDEASLAALANSQRNRDQTQAETITSRAGTLGTIGGYIGGFAGSLRAGDPENFAGGGLGGAGSKTIAREIIKRGIEEGTVNTVAGAIALPGQSADSEHMGNGPMTAKDMLQSVEEQGALGFTLGALGASAPHVARKAKAVGGKLVEKTVDVAAKVAPDATLAASIRAGTVQDRALLTEYRKLHSPYDVSTPDERAAANVVQRDVEVKEASPLQPGASAANEHRLDAIAQSLGVDLKPPPLPTTTPVQTATVKPDGQPRQPASFTSGLHAAEGTGKNPNSSATGHFQFIDSTWLEYAPRVADTSGMSRAQILGLRQNKDIAGRAEQMFRGDNARYLRDRGLEDSAGNLSLAHFLGKHDAANVLRAAPDTPVSQLVNAASIRANPQVFSKHGTAGSITAWAHKRIGATVDHPPARPDSVPAYDPADETDYASVRPYETTLLRPDQIETDAGLMQYKSGGDDAGVTDKLAGVTSWNPILSSEIMVWEGLDGRRVVVDGHQRTGLAKRLYADDPSIHLPAIVIREADGISAADARTLGALRNINLGTGSLIDNTRVLRDAPSSATMMAGAENRRSIQGLANLNHESFGAAVNGVIDPSVAAQIGLNAPGEPDTHMAMVDLLLKNRIRNPAEAGAIVRQARADGYGTAQAEQLSMFGDQPTQSLYVPIARILAAATKKLGEEKRTFRTLSDQAGRIEGAGNVLDRGSNQDRVIGAVEAQAILAATAHRSGPVRDALIAAARAELAGAKRGDAVAGFLDELGKTDLRAAAAEVGRDGSAGEPSGEAGGGDAVSPADGELPDSIEPSLFDQAVDGAARAEAFSDPVGAGAKAQTAILEHDLLMDAGFDLNVADRQRQETALKAASPLQSVAEQEGTMGLGLFDVADQPTFRLDGDGDARPLADILAETEADTMAAEAVKACLQ